MKTSLSAIGAAIVLGLVFYVIGRPLEIYDYVVILFATSIVVWTYEQYAHKSQH
jgi:hypothetical protein